MKCAVCGDNLRPAKGRSSYLEHEHQNDCVFVDVEMGGIQWVTLNAMQEAADASARQRELLKEIHALLGKPIGSYSMDGIRGRVKEELWLSSQGV